MLKKNNTMKVCKISDDQCVDILMISKIITCNSAYVMFLSSYTAFAVFNILTQRTQRTNIQGDN